MESCTVSFATLLLRTEMRIVAGTFNDQLDGDEWCLKEYVRRIAARGYRTCITGRLHLTCTTGQQFGSAQRRNEMMQNSRSAYIAEWGIPRHYCLYFGKEADAGSLGDTVATILDGARQGDRFTLLLHRRQYSAFRKTGWNGLHTGIELYRIPLLFSVRSLQKKIAALYGASPDMLAVCGSAGITFPGVEAAISRDEMLGSIEEHSTTVALHPQEVVS